MIQKWFRMHSGALPAILVSLSNRWNVLYTPVGREVPPQQLAQWARLAAALDACEALFEELGWGDKPARADAGDNSKH